MTHERSQPNPELLADHYTAFVRPGRILLTGHSHQAWPDAARKGLIEAWQDAADRVDGKWDAVFGKVVRVQSWIAERIGAQPDDIALGQNTHELVTRFLSALPLTERPHLVTTAGEFHSLSRQLARLEEAGVEVSRIAVEPIATLAKRLADAVRPTTAALLASTVLFQTSTIVPNLAVAVAAAQAQGAQVLLDAYHAFGVVPFAVGDYGADPVFVVAGGYKYAQWGEGVCWMRVPSGCQLRPVFTGWFSDFANLDALQNGGPIGYGPTSATRFAGSTFDPVSVYRAAAVIDFFDREDLSLARLRALSLQQTGRLIARLAADFTVLTPFEDAARGGFVAISHPGAADIVKGLRQRGIFVDSRGDVLRLGPAPYISLHSIDVAVDHLRELCHINK